MYQCIYVRIEIKEMCAMLFVLQTPVFIVAFSHRSNVSCATTAEKEKKEREE